MTSTRYSIKVLNHYFVRLKLNFTLDVKRNLNKKLKKKKKDTLGGIGAALNLFQANLFTTEPGSFCVSNQRPMSQMVPNLAGGDRNLS